MELRIKTLYKVATVHSTGVSKRLFHISRHSSVTMSPSRIIETKLVVTPLKHGADKKCKIGATITGIDLNNISNDELLALKDATHEYQVVVIKNQHDLDPIKHWELITRLDPEAPKVHGHGTVKEFSNLGGILAVSVSIARIRIAN